MAQLVERLTQASKTLVVTRGWNPCQEHKNKIVRVFFPSQKWCAGLAVGVYTPRVHIPRVNTPRVNTPRVNTPRVYTPV